MFNEHWLRIKENERRKRKLEKKERAREWNGECVTGIEEDKENGKKTLFMRNILLFDLRTCIQTLGLP